MFYFPDLMYLVMLIVLFKVTSQNRRRESTGERKSEQTGQNVFAIYTQSLKQVEKAIKKP